MVRKTRVCLLALLALGLLGMPASASYLRRRAKSNKSSSIKQNKKKKKKRNAKKSKKSKKEDKQESKTFSVCTGTDASMSQILATSTAVYDYLVLDELTDEHLSWELVPFSGATTFEISLSSSITSEESNALKNGIFGTASQPNSMLSAVPVVYGTGLQLNIPQLLQERKGCLSVHVKIPISAQQLCVEGECARTLCPLSHTFDRFDLATGGVSFAAANNHHLFGDSRDCIIEKPACWDDFVADFFPDTTLPPELLYMLDPDNDGLSNIVEYYGPSLVSPFTLGNAAQGVNRNLHPLLGCPTGGTNPLMPDSDADLFGDGYEWQFGLELSGITEDSDGDGLTNFEEQILGTNPFSQDTDGDGLSDKFEADTGSDPLDDTDRRTEVESAQVRLTVGDPSGSHSERYNMIVGSRVQHQATEFGVVSTEVYTFPEGVYQIQVVHRDSNLANPDYDYTAAVSLVSASSPQVTFSVADPEGILGSHFESTFDFAAGKVATMTITVHGGSTDQDTRCSATPKPCDCFDSCSACNDEGNPESCFWNRAGFCGIYVPNSFSSKPTPDDCACDKCEVWYEEEKGDRSWIEALPRCPCRVELDPFKVTHTVPASADVDPAAWSLDPACNFSPFGLCFEFHEGAHGCIRAYGNDGITMQQCCYNIQGQIMPHGTLGAGTPDRVSYRPRSPHPRGLTHDSADVEPFKDCCKRCEDEAFCSKYIGVPGPGGAVGARSDNLACAPN